MKQTNWRCLITAFSVIVTFQLACRLGQSPAAPKTTPTETATLTSTPTATFSPTATIPPSPTLTPAPVPVCHPNNIIRGEVDEALPEYIDMLGVATRLDGTHLAVMFIMRDIPEEITIHKANVEPTTMEIAWGVAIDTDSDPDTGLTPFMTGAAGGYEYVLQAYNIKEGPERSGTIQDLFRNQTSIWITKENNNGWRESAPGSVTVDREAKTIILNGNIKGITPDSYLYFFTASMDAEYVTDEICAR